jgi:hypothetical protein
MSMSLRQDFTLGKCHMDHNDTRGTGAARASWQAFFIDRHAADLCDKCAKEWTKTWQENGGTVTVKKRSTRMTQMRQPSRTAA